MRLLNRVMCKKGPEPPIFFLVGHDDVPIIELNRKNYRFARYDDIKKYPDQAEYLRYLLSKDARKEAELLGYLKSSERIAMTRIKIGTRCVAKISHQMPDERVVVVDQDARYITFRMLDGGDSKVKRERITIKDFYNWEY